MSLTPASSLSARLLGPARINYNTASIATQAKCFDVPAGTLVIGAWVFIVTPWNSATSDLFTVGIGPADWATGDWWGFLVVNAHEGPAQDALSGVSQGAVTNSSGNNGAGDRMGFTNQAGAIIASVSSVGGGLSAGAADVYVHVA